MRVVVVDGLMVGGPSVCCQGSVDGPRTPRTPLGQSEAAAVLHAAL